MMRFILILPILVLQAIAASGQSSLKVGSPAPAFSGVTLDETEYDLDRLCASVVVMTFGRPDARYAITSAATECAS